MTAPTQPTTSLDLKDFFSAAEARSDRWRQLNAAGRAWETAVVQGHPEDKLHAEAARLLREIVALEHYWAYPGPRLMAAVGEAVEERNAGVFARLLQKISSALVTGSYRHEGAAWDPLQDGEAGPELLVPDAQQGDGHKPYFEVLVVTPTDPSLWERGRNDLKRLRRPEDPFVYEVVQVATFEDAVLGTIFNANVQAVVIHDGFLFHSRHDLPVLRQFLLRHLSIDPATTAPGELAVTLARAIKNYRPELDVYLLTDRAVEQLAGSEEAAPLRRVFHSVEEIMEIHLAVLDGVGERYETPFFANLKKYAQRPIGTFHALPIARGKSIFRSNWIRDMGEFYGANLFLAESSATTGGLDSLLEPTGNIKVAQDKAARALGGDRSFFVTNGTSTSNKIIHQALLTPGDIVLIDRDCHKSHHYGLVLAGAQPLYIDAFPLTQYSMYGSLAIKPIKQALLQLKSEGKLDQAKMLVLTNCTFDGHVANVKRTMLECLAIKPDLIFLWDEAWFGFARFSPFLRPRTAMGAAGDIEAWLDAPKSVTAYERQQADLGSNPSDDTLLNTRLIPDPRKVKLRVYQTHSTHKSMSALRQGSMLLVKDVEFHTVQAQ